MLRIPVTRIVTVSTSFSHGEVMLDANGVDPIASMIYWYGLDGWEPETVPVFLRLVQPDTCILDVGANTGLFSLLAARHSPTTTVHAVEPVQRVFSMLMENVRRNALPNVACHRLALANSRGLVPMYVPQDDVPVMASLLPHWRPGSERIDVEACTVDDFVAAHDISALDLIKIDTEGAEDAVLEGAERTLANQRPFIICEVLAAGDTAKRLNAQLRTANYTFFRLGKDGPEATDRILGNVIGECANYLFVPVSRLEEARSRLRM
jgi:FkbM family methyltransferase